jgi:hypothetical protein
MLHSLRPWDLQLKWGQEVTPQRARQQALPSWPWRTHELPPLPLPHLLPPGSKRAPPRRRPRPITSRSKDIRRGKCIANAASVVVGPWSMAYCDGRSTLANKLCSHTHTHTHARTRAQLAGVRVQKLASCCCTGAAPSARSGLALGLGAFFARRRRPTAACRRCLRNHRVSQPVLLSWGVKP